MGVRPLTIINYQHSFGEISPHGNSLCTALGQRCVCLTVPSTMPVLPIFKEKHHEL